MKKVPKVTPEQEAMYDKSAQFIFDHMTQGMRSAVAESFDAPTTLKSFLGGRYHQAIIKRTIEKCREPIVT